MTRPLTTSSSDLDLANGLRANPNLVAVVQGAAQAERARAGRYTQFVDMRTFVAQTWDLVTWNEAPLTPVGQLRHGLRALACMTAIADLSDKDAFAVSLYSDLHMMTGGPAIQESTRRQVAENRATVMASHPELAALAGLSERRTAVMKAAQAIVTAQAEAAAPAMLLADLRARGVFLVVQDNMLGVPVGPAATRLTAMDRAAIVQHKSPLVALLTAEAARPSVVVLA